MDYCQVERSYKIPFESLHNYMYQYKLDKQYEWGETINVNNEICILSNTFNCVFTTPEFKLKVGDYANLVPLRFVNLISSNKSLNFKGFKELINKTDFYSLDGFDKNMNEILGEYLHTRTIYYYMRIEH